MTVTVARPGRLMFLGFTVCGRDAKTELAIEQAVETTVECAQPSGVALIATPVCSLAIKEVLCPIHRVVPLLMLRC